MKVQLLGVGAAVLVAGGVAGGMATAQGSTTPRPATVRPAAFDPYNIPIAPGYTQAEPVSKLTEDLCLAVINGTRAQVLHAPADQRSEILAVESWCNALAIKTNPVKIAHKG